MGENKGGTTKERRADKERAESQEGETDGVGQMSNEKEAIMTFSGQMNLWGWGGKGEDGE